MNKNAGFTLIELLVVVLIIGILSAVAFPQYQAAVDKARFTHAQTLVGTIRAAQNVYYMANGAYTPSWEDLDISIGTVREDAGHYVDVSKDIYCYIGGNQNEYGGCAYSLANGGRALYLTYWETGRNLCYATVSSERANKLCKSVTGTTSSSVLGSDNIYRF